MNVFFSKPKNIIMLKLILSSALTLILFACQAQPPKPKNVAIFIHQSVQLLDFTGPAEVFTDAGFNVYTVAATTDQIISQGFLKVTPDYSIDNCPPPDIVVLPGGATNIPLENPKVIQWIQATSKNAQFMLSVCTGAMLLAKAGLLDGKKATTHYCCQDDLARYPNVTVVKGKRFIDNGNVITTEGISAGIDGSLYLVSRINGRPAAEKTARYMMYDWKPDQLDVLIIKN